MSADATIPSRTAARVAHGGSGHAGTVDHYPACAAAHTGLRDHAVGLISGEIGIACAAEASANPNKANTIVLIIVSSRRFTTAFVWSPRIAGGRRRSRS